MKEAIKKDALSDIEELENKLDNARKEKEELESKLSKGEQLTELEKQKIAALNNEIKAIEIQIDHLITSQKAEEDLLTTEQMKTGNEPTASNDSPTVSSAVQEKLVRMNELQKEIASLENQAATINLALEEMRKQLESVKSGDLGPEDSLSATTHEAISPTDDPIGNFLKQKEGTLLPPQKPNEKSNPEPAQPPSATAEETTSPTIEEEKKTPLSSTSLLRSYLQEEKQSITAEIAKVKAKDADKGISKHRNKQLAILEYKLSIIDRKLKDVERMIEMGSSAYGNTRLAKKDEKIGSVDERIKKIAERKTKIEKSSSILGSSRAYKREVRLNAKIEKLRSKKGKIEKRQGRMVKRRVDLRKFFEIDLIRNHNIKSVVGNDITVKERIDKREDKIENIREKNEELSSNPTWYKNIAIIGNNIVIRHNQNRLNSLQKKNGKFEGKSQVIKEKYGYAKQP